MWLSDSIKDFFKKADLVLLGLCLAASLFGVAVIYSATRYMNSNRYIMVQLFAIALGVIAYMVVSFVDIELLTERAWRWLLLFNVLAILILIPLGSNVGGNKSWIDLGIISIQPAEIVKISFIMLMAKQMSSLQREGISRFSSVVQMAGHTVVMCALIAAISGDMGMALVYLLLFLIMMWTAGVKVRWFLLGAAAVGGLGTVAWPHLPNYIRMRVSVLFDHTLDPQGIGYNQLRSILALGSGQLTGQGYLQGTQTQSAGIPAQWTDFIYSVAGEEFGMVGCIAILLLLSAIILRCIWVAYTARSPQSALIAIGCAGMLGVQVLLNVGMCLYVLPVVGLTLPFFSSGGSSIITLFAAMGIVSSIKMRSLPSWLRDRSNL